jgi:type III pantothenate kinase
MDRVAGVAAAQHLFPNKNCLVIDAGTCITYDFLSKDSVYTGGAIAPGIQMRLKAMHEFTHKLPQPELTWPVDFEGKSTNQALLSGVCLGVADEIIGKIERYIQRYGNVQVLLCGGNSVMLAKHIKNNIFAVPSLVLEGLNQILLFHVKKG